MHRTRQRRIDGMRFWRRRDEIGTAAMSVAAFVFVFVLGGVIALGLLIIGNLFVQAR